MKKITEEVSTKDILLLVALGILYIATSTISYYWG